MRSAEPMSTARGWRSALLVLATTCALAGCGMFERRPAAPVGGAGKATTQAYPAPATRTEPPTAASGKPVEAASPAAATAPAAAMPAATPPAALKAAAAPAPTAPVDPAVQRAFDAARAALAAGRTAEAERGFLALTQSHPDLAGPHANLALIHRAAGRIDQATASIERAIELSPQRADLHTQLGITQRMAGRFEPAQKSYEAALAIDPNHADALLNLGILHDIYLWNGERALELYDRYLQLTPGGDDQVRRWVSDLRNRLKKPAPAAAAATSAPAAAPAATAPAATAQPAVPTAPTAPAKGAPARKEQR